jgi:Zn finger protein HypA/HybF involved in hydrogenase expression
MARKKEFKAGKAFTLGIQELAFMEKHCYEKSMKASTYVNNLIRKEMQAAIKKEKETHGPVTWCTNCSDQREFENMEDRWLCMECHEDKTEIVNNVLEQLKQLGKLK